MSMGPDAVWHPVAAVPVAAKAHMLVTAQVEEMLQMGEHGIQRMVEAKEWRIEIQTSKASGVTDGTEHLIGQIPRVGA